MKFPESCLCGCYDCPSCHPEQFRKVGSRRVYIGDDDIEESEEDIDVDSEECLRYQARYGEAY